MTNKKVILKCCYMDCVIKCFSLKRSTNRKISNIADSAFFLLTFTIRGYEYNTLVKIFATSKSRMWFFPYAGELPGRFSRFFVLIIKTRTGKKGHRKVRKCPLRPRRLHPEWDSISNRIFLVKYVAFVEWAKRKPT